MTGALDELPELINIIKCVFDGQMNMISTTYFKVLRKERALLIVNIAAVAISAVLTCVGVWVFGSIEFTIAGVVMIIIWRNCISERYISNELSISKSNLMYGEILVTLSFIIFSVFFDEVGATVAYLFIYILYLVVFRRTSNGVLQKLKTVMNSMKQR